MGFEEVAEMKWPTCNTISDIIKADTLQNLHSASFRLNYNHIKKREKK